MAKAKGQVGEGAFKCNECHRYFKTQHALDQHRTLFPAHKQTRDVYCEQCEVLFEDESTLNRHLHEAAVHQAISVYSCCKRRFKSQAALDAHMQNSRAHAQTFACNDCGCAFPSQDDLSQHLRTSTAHTSLVYCYDCLRPFSSEQSLFQHLQNSFEHTSPTAPASRQSNQRSEAQEANTGRRRTSVKKSRTAGSADISGQRIQDSSGQADTHSCQKCNRAFKNIESLRQHLEASSAHTSDFKCLPCARLFGSKSALQKHRRKCSSAYPPKATTPLDRFFMSYKGFNYSPDASPSDEYQRLRDFYGWDRDDDEGEAAWLGYREALVQEFNDWYGTNADSLAAWHSLCKAIGFSPLPRSCEACRAVSNVIATF